MRVLKLVLGIISMCIAGLVIFQSCAVGIGDAIFGSGEVGGAGGIIVGLFMLAGGIVMTATRKSVKKGGAIAGLIIYLIGAAIGFASAGSYKDLKVYSVVCIILAAVNLLTVFIKAKAEKEV